MKYTQKALWELEDAVASLHAPVESLKGAYALEYEEISFEVAKRIENFVAVYGMLIEAAAELERVSKAE